MLAGQMTSEIDRETPQAQAGLTCLACHAIDQIDGVTGNGNYNIADEQEDPYLFAEAEDGPAASSTTPPSRPAPRCTSGRC